MALIELEESVEFNTYVDTIQMADAADGDFAGESDCFIIGWGGDQCKTPTNTVFSHHVQEQTKQNKSFFSISVPGGSHYPTILQEAQTPVYTNADCSQYHPGIYAGHVCVGVRMENGACYVSSETLFEEPKLSIPHANVRTFSASFVCALSG